MLEQSEIVLHFQKFLETARRHKAAILWPVALFTTLAVGYAVLKRPVWEASQPMLLRDAAVASVTVPGRFLDADSRKTAQETVLELTKSPSLIEAALKKVGPPPSFLFGRKDWPTRDDIDAACDGIRVKAPKGAEFGETEVIYLSVRQSNRQRAEQLAQAVGDELESRLKEIRNQKARSAVDELTKSSQLAQDDLAAATQQLKKLEQGIGSDLIELRSMTDASSGDSNLRKTLIEIKSELRQAQRTHDTNEKLLVLLQAAQSDPHRILGTPNELLESQPTLRRLKDGLVDAQLLSARLMGMMSTNHPRVQAALISEQEIRKNLHKEIASAREGLHAELRLSEGRVKSLDKQSQVIESRLDRLVSVRADYNNALELVRRRSRVVQEVDEKLAGAQADQAAAQSVSLLTRWESPQSGNYPIGPSRKTIAAAGPAAGLLAGLGIVFILTPFGITTRSPGSTGQRTAEAVAHERARISFRRIARQGMN